jgi:lipoprotein-anchoring transpeptidase ErfK/SrfK
MKLLDALARRFLLLAALVLSGCAALESTPRKPATAPPIPSYGGKKRVVVSLSEQRLHAFDGNQCVFETRVSTGQQPKYTPTGHFRAMSKEIIHYSSLYQNSPMPFSVRFHGNYYLHGYYVVPDYPASHGCIRLPLRHGDVNPAQQFYEWVRIGTRIRVIGRWEGPRVIPSSSSSSGTPQRVLFR